MHFFSLNEAIYVKVLCKPLDVTEMEGGMIITSEGLKGHKLLKAPGLTAPVFLLFMTIRRTILLHLEIIFCYSQEANMFVCT